LLWDGKSAKEWEEWEEGGGRQLPQARSTISTEKVYLGGQQRLDALVLGVRRTEKHPERLYSPHITRLEVAQNDHWSILRTPKEK